MTKNIPRADVIRVVLQAVSVAALAAALASVTPKQPPRVLTFSADALVDVAYENAVAPITGMVAFGKAEQAPWDVVRKGDAVAIAVDGRGRVICVPPEGVK